MPHQENKGSRYRQLRLETETGLTYPEANVAIEIQFIDGRKDLFVALDVDSNWV